MNELDIPDVVQDTKNLLGSVRQSLVKVASNLHLLRATNQFEGKFGQWAEETFGLSQSMTSKLLTIYDAWVIRAGIPQEQIEGQDYEKLYGYVPLLEGKSPEEALAQVRTWSRKDIKDEKQAKSPCPHTHIEWCCTDCWSVIPT